ncbi:hypothetical protein NE857_26075 [Nocardiopsis exhalans]|uniref:Uncharacterized protein n=2 Tax=Nocardiopsis TaxID=2013 RepID=A0A840W897_9ACTN|nr:MULTISPECIES: hypothetical protein [Nocardiopsis]MBB5492262.1 hypothetical protein [Nocardiopsis metallicus]USY18725.1 hypothetical protein NE857_26075 [Nocardiopsis exhalans]
MTAHAPRLLEALEIYFEYAEVTSHLLRALYDLGPRGMIVANFRSREFETTFTLDHTDELVLPVYGYGDLTHDLGHLREHFGTWDDLVSAVDSTAYDCLAERIEHRAATPYAVIRMRERLEELGFSMTTAPSYRRRYLFPGHYQGPSVREVRETYIDRAHPQVRVMLKHPLPEKGQRPGPSLIKITDHDRHVKGWPKTVPHQFTANAQACLIRDRVNAHLARTRA